MSVTKSFGARLARAAVAVALAAPVPALALAGLALAAPGTAYADDAPARVGAAADRSAVAGSEALTALEALGVTPFLYPTAAFCGGPGATLGKPAMAGAVPGPWPKHNIVIPGLDLDAVKSGQTMFTFVPSDPGRSGVTGMRVAWLNLDTRRGGIAEMGTLDEVLGGMVPEEVPTPLRPLAEQAVRDFFLAAVPATGIRAVPVNTGKGTVLAAVFGTTGTGNSSCFYLPTVGITTVP
ncbi:hypothetical protein [Nocardia sp. NPDC050435]|uniref:hypothetical protein n=1 Tax=Nocardia sp. NPDC050435 TaxID=3155040 RepID=UPI00340660E9